MYQPSIQLDMRVIAGFALISQEKVDSCAKSLTSFNFSKFFLGTNSATEEKEGKRLPCTLALARFT